MRKLKIFVGSPGDVAAERRIARSVIKRMAHEFSGLIDLETYLWERHPMYMTADYQSQICRPSECDIVVVILWSRLGSPPGDEFKDARGKPFRSGTEFEIYDALSAWEKSEDGKPAILVWQNLSRPMVPINEGGQRERDFEEVARFAEKLFSGKGRRGFEHACHSYLTIAAFESDFEAVMRKSIAGHLPGGDEHAKLQRMRAEKLGWREHNPYRGLQIFGFQDTQFFYGRTQEREDVLRLFNQQEASGQPRCVLITGASGSGKSSLARAGIVPALTGPEAIPGIAVWRKACVTPEGDPGSAIGLLAHALVADGALPELLDADDPGADDIARTLNQGAAACVSAVTNGLKLAAQRAKHSWEMQFEARIAEMSSAGRGDDVAGLEKQLAKLRSSPSPQARLALVVDQFEQALPSRSGQPSEEALAFYHCLKALAECGRVFVIVTLRNDYLDRVAGRLDWLIRDGKVYSLVPPDRINLAKIISQPARLLGVEFGADQDGTPLDERLLDDAADHPENLPLIGYCLQFLYEKALEGNRAILLASDYEALGGGERAGIEAVLACTAEGTFASLAPPVQAAFDDVMHHLVLEADESGQATLARAARPAEIDAIEGGADFVEAFVEARLLTVGVADGGSGESKISVSHEALLRHWGRAQEWVKQHDHREFLRLRANLVGYLNQWIDHERSNDYLLKSGEPLREGQRLLELHAARLDSSELVGFIEKSTRLNVRRKRLFRSAVLLVICILAIALVVTLQNLGRRIESERIAGEFRSKAEEVIEETNVELVDEFKALGRLSALDGVADISAAYFESLPENLRTPESDRLHASVRFNQARIQADRNEFQQAVASFEAAASLWRSVIRNRPEDGDGRRSLAATLGELAEVERGLGDFDAARTHLDEALGVLPRAVPAEISAEALAARAAIYHIMSKLALDQEDLPRAARAAEQFSQDTAALLEKSQENEHFLLRSDSLNASGDIADAEGDETAAANYFAQAVKTLELLNSNSPDNAGFKESLAVAYDRLADSHRSAGNDAGAMEFYTKYATTYRSLCARDPTNRRWERELSVALRQIGDQHRAPATAEVYAEALRAYGEALSIRERLALLAPDSLLAQDDLWDIRLRLGKKAFKQKDAATAIEHFTAAHTQSEQQYQKHPTAADWPERVLSVAQRLGYAHVQTKTEEGFERAIEIFDQALIFAMELEKVGNLPEGKNFQPKEIEADRDQIRAAIEARQKAR